MALIIENVQDKVEADESILNILNKAAELCLEHEGFQPACEISVLLVDDDKIREINHEFRSIDKPTDVLSFPIMDIFEGKINSQLGDMNIDENTLLLGDIIISLETAEKQAEGYGHSFERELAFLMSHGVFHLLGYDHENDIEEKNMLTRQEIVLKEMGLSR